MGEPIGMLRAILADYQDVISGPDVRRGMDAIDDLEAALREIAGYGISRPTPEWEPVISADAVKIARDALGRREARDEATKRCPNCGRDHRDDVCLACATPPEGPVMGEPTPAEHAATVERALRNYHDSGCFVYLPSGACDCGAEPNTDALAALHALADIDETVRTLQAALRRIASNETVLATPGVLDASYSGRTAQEYKRIAREALARQEARGENYDYLMDDAEGRWGKREARDG